MLDPVGPSRSRAGENGLLAACSSSVPAADGVTWIGLIEEPLWVSTWSRRDPQR